MDMYVFYNDVMTWKHFSHCWSFVRGITGGFHSQKISMRSFGILFVILLNKLLNKHSIVIWATLTFMWCYCNLLFLDSQCPWSVKCFIMDFNITVLKFLVLSFNQKAFFLLIKLLLLFEDNFLSLMMTAYTEVRDKYLGWSSCCPVSMVMNSIWMLQGWRRLFCLYIHHQMDPRWISSKVVFLDIVSPLHSSFKNCSSYHLGYFLFRKFLIEIHASYKWLSNPLFSLAGQHIRYTAMPIAHSWTNIEGG